jgi:hypothetical protein
MRQRDDRFVTQDHHRTAPHPLRDLTGGRPEPRVFQPSDFTYDAAARTCVCPAGKALYRAGRDVVTRGYVADRFHGTKRDCGPCPLRAQCLRTPERTPTRQVAFFRGKATGTPESHTARMQRRLDTPEGRARYGRRFATVEPVFGNLRANKRLDRFTLRGRRRWTGSGSSTASSTTSRSSRTRATQPNGPAPGSPGPRAQAAVGRPRGVAVAPTSPHDSGSPTTGA